MSGSATTVTFARLIAAGAAVRLAGTGRS